MGGENHVCNRPQTNCNAKPEKTKQKHAAMTVKSDYHHSSGNNLIRNIKEVTFLLETVQQELLDTFFPFAGYIIIQLYLKHSLVAAFWSAKTPVSGITRDYSLVEKELVAAKICIAVVVYLFGGSHGLWTTVISGHWHRGCGCLDSHYFTCSLGDSDTESELSLNIFCWPSRLVWLRQFK